MEYTIYKVEDYGSSAKCEREGIEKYNSIDDVISKISTDNKYNEKLVIGQHYKFFLDIEVENLKIETVQKSLLDFFNNHLKLKLVVKDIKYTHNDKKYNRKKGGIKEESYHITIPKYYSELENFLPIIQEIKKLYNYDIDESVYRKGSWFRLPNQTGQTSYFKVVPLIVDKKHYHTIQNGKLKDFILQYVDKTNSINIKKAFFEYKPKEEPKEKVKKSKKQVDIITTSSEPSDIEDLDILLNGLTVEFIDVYINWIRLGHLLLDIGSTVEKYIEISKKGKKYEDGACELKWTGFKKRNQTIKTLWWWVKTCNIQYFNSVIILKNKQEEIQKFDRNISIKVDKKYLTEKDENEKLIIDKELVQYFDDLLINNRYKSINIKSPYGSSKTQLIHKVIEQYDPEKVLWLSFRKTLSDDIHKNFKDLKFEDYRNGKLDSKRLIIQLESLLKLEELEEQEEDENGDVLNIIHKYDLIMLDEIESLLNQFNSESTFSGKSRRTFEYLEQLLKKSDNIISLDGDLGHRSFNFLKHFDRCLNIENLNKRNDKTLYFTEEINEYDDEIFELLTDNKKIAIASMTSQKADYYYNWIKEKFPNLKVGIYTGSDNSNRKDLKNVNEEWIKKDVVIYSPTITAGVSFDVEDHFYKIFGVISCGSCCQRDFLQMLARIRNPIENKITVLNDGIEGNLKCFFNYDEVKQSLIDTRKLKVIYKDGKSKMDLDLNIYDINSIFNDVERLNKNEPLFLEYLYKIASDKGYKLEFSEYEQLTDNEKDNIIKQKVNISIKIKESFKSQLEYQLLQLVNEEEPTKQTQLLIKNMTKEIKNSKKVKKCILTRQLNKVYDYHITAQKDDIMNEERKELLKKIDTKKDKIIKAETIGSIELENLLKKQNKQEENNDEHFQINRSVLSKQIGLILENGKPASEKLIEYYYNCPSSIKNFSCLIDEDNIKEVDDSFTENKRKQVFLIKEFLRDIGIKNIYETKQYSYKEFTKILEDKNIFKKENQIVFHTGKKAFSITSAKEKYINTLLKNYKLTFKISYNGQKTEKNKIYTFSRLHHIEEIIYYKKENKYIKDKDNLVEKPEVLLFQEFFIKKEEKVKPEFIVDEDRDYHQIFKGKSPLEEGVNFSD
jgi:hypothetical protein